jgi:glycosyltransferase involved in cell wall biosynthesis
MPDQGQARIVFVIGSLGNGGQERQLYYLLSSMDRKRYRPAVAVWSFQEGDRYVDAISRLGVPIHSLGDGSRFGKLVRLRRLVKSLRAEVVHSYAFYTNFAAWFAAAGRRLIPVGSIRSGFRDALAANGRTVGALSARWPSDQVCNSEAAAGEIREARGFFRPHRVSVVRNGVDLERFLAAPPDTTGPPRILGVGSLVGFKRWDWLIELASGLESLGDDFVLEIAGEGDQHAALEKLIRDRGLQDRVRLLGTVDDVPLLLRRCRLLAHVSSIEGLPNVVIEAMAAARPVVACDVGDVGRVVENGRSGFVVGREDRSGFLACLRRLLADPDLCLRMGQAARERVESDFRIGRMVESTWAAYRAAGWREA